MPTYTITPEDILFFRDGRPMEAGAGSGGHGARWPEPSVIFDALHAALHRAFPAEDTRDFQSWEHPHRYGRSSNRDMARQRTQRFGSLVTAGPFPVLNGAGGQAVAPRWLFPRPQDVAAQDSVLPALLPLKNTGGHNDLPAPLLYSLASLAEPSKDEPLPWWTKQAVEAYLSSETKPLAGTWSFRDDALFAREWHTGIAIDPATQTTGHGEAAGKIYAAQYLRLRDGVTLGIYATMPMKNGQPDKLEERIAKLFPENRVLIVGGQQRACQVEELKQDGRPAPLVDSLPVSPPITGERVKWLLLSPAVFPAIQAEPANGISAHSGGWLPNWIAPCDNYRVWQGDKEVAVEKGRVLLKPEFPRNGQPRDQWRKLIREAPFLDCRLVAARVPKPIVLTGWTEAVHLKDTPWKREHGPRPTLVAVPAGAVYYFEGKDASRLADTLSWHGERSAADFGHVIKNRRSTLLGEKGYGLGVCGTWDFYENVAGHPAK
jgi:CRISPR-associated protein Cmr3